MKKILASFGWMLLLIPLISVAGARTAFKLNKDALVESRDVKGFNSISSSGSFKVFVDFGVKEGLRLEGDEEILREIETKVENGVLRIRFKDKTGYFWKFRNYTGRVNIYVTALALNALTSSGSGDIEVNGVLKAGKLTTTVSGSGNINLTMDADDYVAIISGSGQTTAKGTTRTADVKVSGSGNFRGRDLKTSYSNVKVSGSGNVDIVADSTLDAAVSGSGNIRYGGSASKVTATKSGSGKVSKM
jgi:hypothetical protein